MTQIEKHRSEEAAQQKQLQELQEKLLDEAEEEKRIRAERRTRSSLLR